MTALGAWNGSGAVGDDAVRTHLQRRAQGERLRIADRLTSLVDNRDAPAIGRLLVLAAGAIVALGAPLLQPSAREWWTLAAISVIMLAAVAVSARTDWSRLTRRAALVHPLLVMAALAALGIVAPAKFAPLGGVVVLCFAYIGLTQRPGTSLIALVPATVTFLIVYGEITAPVLVRLAIALMIYLLLGELLAQMTVRQALLTRALELAANCDALTGLANRRDWDIRVALAEPGDTVVLCDIDHFKRINDVRGHAAGDQVLADFGTVLRASLRGGDYCARYGGEEFVLLLPATSINDAAAVIGRLHQRWAHFRPDVTFSAGIAICRVDRDNPATLAAADAALYAAKDAGRNTDRIEQFRTDPRAGARPAGRGASTR